jgi:hypothetical protein
MDQAANGSIAQIATDQVGDPIQLPEPGVTISQLASHHPYVWALPDKVAGDAREGVLAMILAGEPADLNETLALAHVAEIEVECLLTNEESRVASDDIGDTDKWAHAENAAKLAQLHRALQAIKRALVRAGARSPMVDHYQAH